MRWLLTDATAGNACGPRSNSSYWGSFLSSSNDFGKTWSDPEAYNIKFPEGSEVSLKQIWQIVPGPRRRAGHALLRGRAGGAVQINRRRRNAGRSSAACSIIRIERNGCPAAADFACIRFFPIRRTSSACLLPSQPAASIARTMAARIGSRATKAFARRFLPPDQQYPEWGQCVHKVVNHPSNPDRMFLQHHWGVYRSDECRRFLERHRQRPAFRFWLRDGDRSA